MPPLWAYCCRPLAAKNSGSITKNRTLTPLSSPRANSLGDTAHDDRLSPCNVKVIGVDRLGASRETSSILRMSRADKLQFCRLGALSRLRKTNASILHRDAADCPTSAMPSEAPHRPAGGKALSGIHLAYWRVNRLSIYWRKMADIEHAAAAGCGMRRFSRLVATHQARSGFAASNLCQFDTVPPRYANFCREALEEC